MIFKQIKINKIKLKNRIVVSPMCQYSAKDGNANDWHLAHYLQMALSGAGMIVIESTAVSSEGRITLGDLGIYSDQNETKLKKMVSSDVMCDPFVEPKLVLEIFQDLNDDDDINIQAKPSYDEPSITGLE